MGGLLKIDEVREGVHENYLIPIGGSTKKNVTTSKVVAHFYVKTSIIWGVYVKVGSTYGAKFAQGRIQILPT